MGRGAGNAETELMLATDITKQKQIKGFHLNNFLEELKKLKNKLNWGSSFAYAFTAKSGYSQADMMNLLQKRRLDPSTAIEVLEKEKKDKINFKNYRILKKKIFKNYSPILVGGGNSQCEYGSFLFDQILSKKILIFSSLRSLINFSKLNSNFNNTKVLIITGNEFQKSNPIFLKKIFRKIKINFFIIEENFVPKKLNIFPKNKTIYSDSNALNPLLLTGFLLKKLNIRKLQLAFFDGNPKTEQDQIIMNETLQGIKILSKNNLKISSITKNFFGGEYINPWSND
jgi:hypothetical protein